MVDFEDSDLLMYVKKCVDCGTNTLVSDSRERPDGAIYRQRYCPKCGYRFRTVEIEECMSDYADLLEKVNSLKKENERLKATVKTARRNLETILKI